MHVCNYYLTIIKPGKGNCFRQRGVGERERNKSVKERRETDRQTDRQTDRDGDRDKTER